MHMSLSNLATRPILALFAFVAWTLFLVLAIAAVRVAQVLLRRVPANGFTSGVPHGGDAYWRLNRAHVNAVENLAVFATLVLGSALLGAVSSSIARAAEIVVCARVAQSVFHVLSGRSWAVNLRFTAFLAQLACFAVIIAATLLELTGHGLR